MHNLYQNFLGIPLFEIQINNNLYKLAFNFDPLMQTFYPLIPFLFCKSISSANLFSHQNKLLYLNEVFNKKASYLFALN